MPNYKVGDLDVTISGVSKDAVSSLDEVIKQLDALQGKLGVIGGGFKQAFKSASGAATRAVVGDLVEVAMATEDASESQKKLNDTVENGTEDVKKYSISAEEATKKMRRWQAEMRGESFALVPYQAAQSLVAISESQESVNAQFERLNALLNMGTYSRLSYDVGNLATQWKNLYTTMQRSDVADALTGGQFSAEAQNRLARITHEYLNKKQVIDETNEAFKRLAMTEQELALYDFQQENASRKQRIAYLNLMLATGQAGDKTREYAQELKRLTKQQQIADKVAGKSATGGFSKLIKQIGRIALYRTIRRGLQMITQTLKESIQAYAQVDDNINKMMSQLTSSTKVISLSLGTMIFPILQAITPVVQGLSQGFANMANAINKSMALANNQATYTKINTDALKDYRKELNKTSGALLDFDKFRALSSKQDTASTFLSTEDVSALDETEKKYSGIYFLVSGIGDLLGNVSETIEKIGKSAAFQTIMTVVEYTVGGLTDASSWLLKILNTSGLLEPILGSIAGYLTYIGATKLFTALSTGKLLSYIIAVVQLLKEDVRGTLKMVGEDFVKLISSTKALAASIGAVSTSIIYLASNWKDLNKTQRLWIPLASTLIGLVVGIGAALVLSITAIKEALKLNPAAVAKAAITAGLFTAAAGIAIGTAVSSSQNAAKASIPAYANGASNIDSGSLFVAGEAGKTEMVYSGENGKANVANIQQMYQSGYMANINALNEWWKTAKYDIPQLQPASDTGIYQAASRGAGKAGKRFANY